MKHRIFKGLLVALLMSTAFQGALLAPKAAEAGPPSDFFGIVGRDPWYEYGPDPVTHIMGPNKSFLESMGGHLREAGANWIRIEFHAEYDQPVGPGYINWDKYDWFVNECAPKYGLKILALINSGALADTDPAYRITHLEDPTDRPDTAPDAGTNYYIRAYVQRASEIARRYGDRIAAYEILNEPNINVPLSMMTEPKRQELNPERYANLLTNTYVAIKEASPSSAVIIGGLLRGTPLEDPQRNTVDYLGDIYASRWVQQYYSSAPHPNGNPFPFDGVGSHPFYDTAAEVEEHLKNLHQKMVEWGDPYGKIWVTEVGFQAAPPQSQFQPPTLEETLQAGFLTDIYNRTWDSLAGVVARIFWFKYEDFENDGARANWGLVRLAEYGYNRYSPHADVWIRKESFQHYVSLANPSALPDAPRPQRLELGTFYFPETGHQISPLFQSFWEKKGGLAMFGYPLTEEFETSGLRVQYFQRARLEFHPEKKGTPFEIEITHLGRLLTSNLSFYVIQAFQQGDQRLYFPETGHSISLGFLYYWREHGGLETFGYPLSEEFQEANPADGKRYTVQYFERARFEYHPEFKGTPFEVELGLLGSQALRDTWWYR